MIVDDEPDIVTYFCAVLSDNGYEVVSAGDADEAWARLEESVPDLVTLDVMMPRRSGIAFYKDLKLDERYKDVPAIIISAFSLARDFDGRGFRKLIPDKRVPEPAAFIEKPVGASRLLEAVGRALGEE